MACSKRFADEIDKKMFISDVPDFDNCEWSAIDGNSAKLHAAMKNAKNPDNFNLRYDERGIKKNDCDCGWWFSDKKDTKGCVCESMYGSDSGQNYTSLYDYDDYDDY